MKIKALGDGHTQILMVLPDSTDLDIGRIEGTNIVVCNLPESNESLLWLEGIAKLTFAEARTATGGAISSASTHTRLRRHFNLAGGGHWLETVRREKEIEFGRPIQPRLLNVLRTVGFKRVQIDEMLDRANAANPGTAELSELSQDDQRLLDNRREKRYKKKN